MINTALFSFRNIFVIGVIAVFARTLLHGFVRLVDGAEEPGAPETEDE